ncbi:RNA-binding protein 5 [Nilaparvata lugens]|uniref:RNA-binding protein 5 n=1 Tax=Nilaparvata lugens TaxID=108931 RepID=UPI00193D5149|nr:RNA-binding protein 5 [Nilaparvata lugens]XP_039293901.1 RNA-binding protein 5 [Nilaparvata lugens]
MMNNYYDRGGGGGGGGYDGDRSRDRMMRGGRGGGGGGYEDNRSRDRMMRGGPADRDMWQRAVDDFIDDRRRDRDRSPLRERGDYRERRREGRRGRESPDDRNSMGSGRYNRDNSNDSFRDYNNDDSNNSREWHQRKRWSNNDEDRKYSRGGDRSRHGGDGDRDRSRDYSRERERERREDSDRGGRDRSSSEDGYDSSDTRDSDYSRGRFRDFDKMSYKDQVPNRTIIIRGLAQHITEGDIREDTIKCKLVPKDIRLIRRKHTGTSRGFAFVEFLTINEAVSWMEMKQGELMLKDHYRAVMQYSLQRVENGREVRISDWHCVRCSAHNFKRRDFCYRCNCTRVEGELMEGVEEVCAHPTNTVLLRGLDALTTEENVLKCIQTVSTLPIKSVRIGRDPVMNTSRGVCYIEMNSVVEAVHLHNSLLLSPIKIDNKIPVISYSRLNEGGNGRGGDSLASAAIAAAQWSHQKDKDEKEDTTSVITVQYTLEDVPKLADYSANLYAKSVAEKTKYFAYYHDYYTKAIKRGEQISLPSSATVAAQAQNDTAPHDAVSLAETPAAPGPAVVLALTRCALSDAPDGSGVHVYPIPDVSTYQYDKTSGYYYDPYTTLYYDANSQYFYNQKLQKFLYWDSVKSTYLPAPTVGQQLKTEGDKEEEQKKAKEKEKQSEKDKVKVAKRIAKDMEKWAKTLNHKKEIARQNLVSQQANLPATKTQGAADIGFAVLERKDLAPRSSMIQAAERSPADNSGLVAAYGQGSDSEDDGANDAQEDEKKLTDWSKLACLLCKRQFPSREVLIKHQQMSDLHKQNMESWYKARGLDPTDAQTRCQQYRDRAKERRQKYGEPDHPQPNRLKENYMKARQATISYEEPTKMGLGSDNLGNKLLQKMGWQEGMGLGKKNQGRTSIIETERRSASAGLGTKSVGVVPGPGETYKDCVKKMMKIRYQEIEENTS